MPVRLLPVQCTGFTGINQITLNSAIASRTVSESENPGNKMGFREFLFGSPEKDKRPSKSRGKKKEEDEPVNELQALKDEVKRMNKSAPRRMNSRGVFCLCGGRWGRGLRRGVAMLTMVAAMFLS